MAGGLFSTAKLFAMTIRESATDGSDFTNPDADYRRLFLGEDGYLHLRDSAGTISDVASSGSGIAATIFDAKGDLIGASAADTAARLAAAGSNDLILAAASGETTGLQWQARSKFKYLTRLGAGDYTTTSTTMVAIDATNLGYLTFTLAVGDVVRCTLVGQVTATVGVGGFDFEVDQPTSADTFIGAGADRGVTAIGAGAVRYPLCAIGLFVATEAGTHGFRPAWIMESGGTNVKILNATSGNSDTLILFSVEKLGPVTA